MKLGAVAFRLCVFFFILSIHPLSAQGETATAFDRDTIFELQKIYDNRKATDAADAAVSGRHELNPREKAVIEMLRAAQQAGPEAVMALRDTLRGSDLDLVMNDIVAAHQQLADNTPPPIAQQPISPVQEEEALQAQQTLEAASRRAALLSMQPDPDENSGKISTTLALVSSIPETAAADLTVGSGCAYATIASAISAAGPGDRILIEGGVNFTENIVIDKDLTLEGGYDGCASGSAANTTIDGNATGRVVDIALGLTVTLKNLNITNGNSGGEGGGIRFAVGDGTGTLNLANVSIYGNTGIWGGGLWIGQNTEVTGTNVAIYDNTATSTGGGVRLYGGQLTLEDSNIYNNTSPEGAGVAARKGGAYYPSLYLNSYADIYNNQALTGSGLGGGLYFSEGTVFLADCSDIFFNDAIDGGGAYLVTSTLTVQGSCSEIMLNTATGNGGGVYALDSTVNMDEDAELYDNDAVNGGGAYLDNSGLWCDKAIIWHNTADQYGGGVHAVNGSDLDMDLGGYPCMGARCSRLSYNTATSGYGGGVYAFGTSDITEVDLRQTFVENNTSALGGGIYAYNSSPVYLYNVLMDRNSGGSVDAVRLYEGASLTGSNNTIAYNDAGGAATGTAIGAYNSTLNLTHSIVWGHATAINPADLTVTDSDIQGGYAGTGNLDVDPLFQDPSTRNFRLGHLSPLIDVRATGQGVDFDNQSRPFVCFNIAAPYDIGADEVGDLDNDGLLDSLEGATCTDEENADSDNDGLIDGLEDANHNGVVDGGETNPCDNDSDNDGILDGTEDANHNRVVDTGETDPLDPDSDDDGIADGAEDANQNGIVDSGETDPLDRDSDDDGIADGSEDANHNGIVDSGETDPRNMDTDGDGIQDGTEMGVTLAGIGLDTDTALFQPDLDHSTTTDPLNADTDGDGLSDGEEDLNRNGRVDPGETDPNERDVRAMPWIPLLLLD